MNRKGTGKEGKGKGAGKKTKNRNEKNEESNKNIARIKSEERATHANNEKVDENVIIDCAQFDIETMPIVIDDGYLIDREGEVICEADDKYTTEQIDTDAQVLIDVTIENTKKEEQKINKINIISVEVFKPVKHVKKWN